MQTICLSALTVVAVGFALWWLRPVMIPFVLAAFLAFALMPLVDGLEVHARLSRTLAVCVALLLAVLVLVGVGLLVKVSVNQVINNAPQYQTRLEELSKRIIGLLGPLGIKIEDGASPYSLFPEGTVQGLS